AVAGSFREHGEQRFEAAVEMQNHLPHERGARAGLVTKLLGGAGEQADDVEAVALAEVLADDELGEEVEGRGLREGRGAVEREEIVGAVGRIGEGAKGWSVGAGAKSDPGGVARGGGGLLRVEGGEPVGRVAVGGELTEVVEPE